MTWIQGEVSDFGAGAGGARVEPLQPAFVYWHTFTPEWAAVNRLEGDVSKDSGVSAGRG